MEWHAIGIHKFSQKRSEQNICLIDYFIYYSVDTNKRDTVSEIAHARSPNKNPIENPPPTINEYRTIKTKCVEYEL